jgi:hypothetical protein
MIRTISMCAPPFLMFSGCFWEIGFLFDVVQSAQDIFFGFSLNQSLRIPLGGRAAVLLACCVMVTVLGDGGTGF